MLAHIEARNTGTMACMQMNEDQIKPSDTHTNSRTTNEYGKKKEKKKNMKKYDRLIKVVFFRGSYKILLLENAKRMQRFMLKMGRFYDPPISSLSFSLPFRLRSIH